MQGHADEAMEHLTVLLQACGAPFALPCPPPGTAGRSPELQQLSTRLATSPPVRPTAGTMAEVMRALLSAGDAQAAVAVFHAVLAQGVAPDAAAVNLLIAALSALGDVLQAWMAVQSAWQCGCADVATVPLFSAFLGDLCTTPTLSDALRAQYHALMPTPCFL